MRGTDVPHVSYEMPRNLHLDLQVPLPFVPEVVIPEVVVLYMVIPKVIIPKVITLLAISGF